ncbi:uncharacterized protein HaLaN_18360, partial [Haematococcus lacustris]
MMCLAPSVAMPVFTGFCIVLLLAVTTDSLSITSLRPWGGSIAGGTRLEISGSFPDAMSGALAVFVGPYACEIVHHYSSELEIVCETAAGLQGSYPVSIVCETAAGLQGSYPVSVVGYDTDGYPVQDTQCCFTYAPGLTPSLTFINPSAGPPGSDVFLYGSPTWSINQDCASDAAASSTAHCIGAILFQDYRCGVDQENIDLAFKPNMRLATFN